MGLSRLPGDRDSHFARLGLVATVNANPWGPHQVVAAKQERQGFPLPGRDCRFLKQVLEAPARPAAVRPQPLPSPAQAKGHRLRGEPVPADASALPLPECDNPGQRIEGNPLFAPPPLEELLGTVARIRNT